MYLRRVKTGWRAEVERNGARQSKTFTLKADAQAWARELEVEIQTQAHAGLAADTRTLHALFDRFATHESPKRKGEATEVKRLDYLKRQIPDVPLKDVNATLLSEWRDRRLRTLKPGSVRREMSLLRSVFDVARREWRLFKTNPLADVKRPPNASPRTRLITQAEVDAVVHALNYREDAPVIQVKQIVAVMFLISIETGMRAGEIPRAVVSGRVAHLAKTKNGDARDVPLSSRALELFAKAPHFDINPGSRDGLFREARKCAGLSGFTYHDSRALALTRLSKKLDVLELARMIGHRSPASLMVYFRQSADDIADKLG